MRLSKLELLGFKSFPNKTELAFDGGLTAIVGPNGCGKTNLLDAIRWVLGEQRVSLLRGSKMEEVIFNGTRDLKPLGMAEVSLVIKNDKGILPVDYREVYVTRRLYRSGESEYLLNGAPCRLRDIIDLFLDTGMGTHAYSVIQPNMIEAVLSDKDEDKRMLFEEASGITKYKLRKKAALRKLEITENDILRINDIITEVERQVFSLRRQVNKAERYKKLNGQVRELEIKLAQADFGDLSEQNRQLEQAVNQLRIQTAGYSADLSKQEAETENLRLGLLEAERQLVAHQRKLSEDIERIHQVERNVLVERERKAGLEKSIVRLKQEIGDLSSRLMLLESESTTRQSEFDQTVRLFGEKEDELDCKEKELLAVDGERAKAKADSEELERKKSEQENALNEKKSKLANIEGSLKQLEQRMESLKSEGEGLSHGRKEIELRISELTGFYHKQDQELVEKDIEKEQLKREIEAGKKKLEVLSQENIKLGNDLSTEKAKLAVFQEMIREYQGFGDGSRYVLSKRASLPGVIDLLANLIDTKEEYLLAIECALGEAAGFLVCENEYSALESIKILEESKQGRATFLILEKASKFAEKMKTADYKDLDGIISRASELVTCQDKYRPVVDLLLGNVLLVRSLGHAHELPSVLESGMALVSLDGQMLRPAGILEGGSKKETCLLGRKYQVQKTMEAVSVMELKIGRMEKERQEMENENQELTRLLNEKADHIRVASEELVRRKIELGQMESERGGVMRSIEANAMESAQDEEQMHNLRDVSNRISSEIELSTNSKSELDGRLLEIGRRLGQIEEERDNQFGETNHCRIELVTLSGKKEQLENDIARLKEMMEDISKDICSKKEQVEDSERSINEITLSSSGVDEKLKELIKQKEQNEKLCNYWQDKYSQVQSECTLKENQLKSIRQAKDGFQNKVHDLELGKLEKSTQMRSIRDRVWEEYQVNLEDLKALPPEERSELESHRQRIRSLKDELSRLGPVNLVASEEYQVSKERLDFLRGQMKDLVGAKESLGTTITKIDETAREMFMQTFAKIRSNFQSVFGQLFEGGEADLALLPEMDLLESPIQISARPRGKRLININQLSGGEKALTAISLIFAIYLVKPSPFCILDEIDAPLDDLNVKRFLGLIQHFSQNTQFLIITHNKLTMETADTLYGVTMEQAGVSKIVSVRLGKQETLAGEHN